jgi:general secretion pathway protein K
MRRPSTRQRGVAVVTALLLTTLAITIVASLFWQQQVQVRSIENQRLQLQKQWILRGALDWTRLILREDARYSKVDHLGEPWATPLAETRLDQYVENESNSDVPDAVLSGGIVDAQSRYNLANRCQNGVVNPEEVAAFARLLTNLRQNPSLAQATATLMQQAQGSSQNGTGGTGSTAPAASADAPQPVNILYADDLLAVPGFTPEALESIRDFVVVLPYPTPINVNTAPAEVLSARIATLSLADAAAAVSMRESAWFKDPGDFTNRMHVSNVPANAIDTKTEFFLVNGNVRLSRATMHMQALIKRNNLTYATEVRWIRES